MSGNADGRECERERDEDRGYRATGNSWERGGCEGECECKRGEVGGGGDEFEYCNAESDTDGSFRVMGLRGEGG